MIDVYKLTKWEEIYVDNFVQSIICNTQKQALIGKSKFRNQHSRKRDVLIYVLWYFVFFLQFTRFKSYFWVQYRILIELYKLPPLSQLVWFNEIILTPIGNDISRRDRVLFLFSFPEEPPFERCRFDLNVLK